MAAYTLPHLRAAVATLAESVQYAPSLSALAELSAGAFRIARALKESGAPRAAAYAAFFAARSLESADRFDHREGHAYAGAYHAARAYLDTARDSIDHALGDSAALPLESLKGWPSEPA